MGGSVPKPLIEILGRPMLDLVVDLHRPFVDRVVVIASPSGVAAIRAWADPRGIAVVEQESPTGMLDAVLLAAPAVAERRPDRIWITWADQVAVLPRTVRQLAEVETAPAEPALVFPTVMRRHPYIHFARDSGGRISAVLHRREGDVMPAEGEGDIGLFAMSRIAFEEDLAQYAAVAESGHGTGERNFLPFIPWLAQRKSVVTFPCNDPMEAVGVNTPEDRTAVESWMRSRNSS